MKRTSFLCLFAVCCTLCFRTCWSFMVLVPKTAYPGSPLNVAVTAPVSASVPISVDLSLETSVYKGKPLGFVSETLKAGETQLLSILVPLLNYSQPQLMLQVMARGGVNYSASATIELSYNSSLILVQTDKAIYRPGQKVRIRVVNVDRNLKPVFVPLTVIIENPKNDKLEEYKDVNSRNGVVERIFELSDFPSLGVWSIHVHSGSLRLYTSTFKVEEFVLPKFSVQVLASPNFLVMSSEHKAAIITVSANYTYGKGVQGRCKLTVNFSASRKDVYFKDLDVDGVAVFDNIEWKLLAYELYNVTVQAEVTDETERKELGETTMAVYPSHRRVKILDSSTTVFRAGLPAYVYVEVSDHSGNPIAPVDLYLRVTIPRLDEVVHVLKVPEGETLVNHTFTLVRSAQKYFHFYRSAGTITAMVNSDESTTDTKAAHLYKAENPLAVSILPMESQILRIGEPFSVKVNKTLPDDYSDAVGYIVITQGNIIKAGRMTDNSVTIMPTDQFCPFGRLLVYMSARGAGTVEEVVVDAMDLTFTGCFKKEVKVEFDSAETRTGTEVEMKVDVSRLDGSNSLPGIHDVFYLAVDQSIILLQGSTDLNIDKVATGLSRFDEINSQVTLDSAWEYFKKYNLVTAVSRDFLVTRAYYIYDYYGEEFSGNFGDNLDYMLDEEASGEAIFLIESYWPHIYHVWVTLAWQGTRTCITNLSLSWLQAFNLKMMQINPGHFGLQICTNSTVFEVEIPPTFMAILGGNAVSKSGGPGGFQSETKIRKDFPDTWLWGQGVTDMNGHMRSKFTLPDTITSWIVSAFAINDEGLAVGREPFKLTAFQLFFLSMNLPYSIKRGEVFVLRITVFNYRSQDVEAVVSLASGAQFLVLDEEEKDGWYEKPLSLPAFKASSVTFKINATSLGLISLQVTAMDPADGQKDEVRRELLVKPEGVERSRALTKVLTLSTGNSLSEGFTIQWPDNIVPDSQRVEVKVTGEVFGQALSGLENLVSVPFGCGEQNMISTVPNIFGLKYIRGTRQVGMEEMASQLAANMKKGYQRQVENYRHKDGSYSAWGEKLPGSVGSTWLTAFVIRSFAQASEFIPVDDSVLRTGVEFLQSRQDANGKFVEKGKVLHSDMQSGTGSDESLTVYVLISMLEASQALWERNALSLTGNINRALLFIKSNLNPEKLKAERKTFVAALAAYGLSLIPNNNKETFDLIDQLLSVVSDSQVPWMVVEPVSLSPLKAKQAAADVLGPPYDVRPHVSRDLEIGAYVLLTYTGLQRLSEGMELMKWLQSQQNSKGGFHSTQDTVMVLQALSEFGSKFRPGESPSHLQVTHPVDMTFALSGSRALLVQTVTLPPTTNKVNVTFTGGPKSVAVVKVVYTYYTYAGEDDQAPTEALLFLETKSTKLSSGLHRVQACVKSSKSLKYTGMFVTTLSLPSGEKPADDQNTLLASNPMASRVDTDDLAIHFYMDQAPPEEGYCLTANLEQHLEFEVQKPGFAKFYPYYDPENVAEVPLALTCHTCGTDTAVMVNMASVFLTTFVCLLASLLACM